MLGKTAGGLLWMARYLERSENTARLVDAGLRIALTRSSAASDEWGSILASASMRHAYSQRYGSVEATDAIDFLLRDPANPSSVASAIDSARTNARLVRTALTREVWEANNVCWMSLRAALAQPVPQTELPLVLATIRQQNALVRGAMHGTMLRNDIYNFARLGTFIERCDNTARILDVKYYVLLPEISAVGSSLDNVQWETILRCASSERAFGWLHGGEVSALQIAEFLILDRRMPRSLAFCTEKILDNLQHLALDYGTEPASFALAASINQRLSAESIRAIFNFGLHQFLSNFIRDTNALATQIERDYRFSS